MTNAEYVIKLYERETELQRICNYHNIFNYDCDDIIQDLYEIILNLKDCNKYVKDDEPNMFIIFAIIKNIIYHFRNEEKKYVVGELFDFSDENEYDTYTKDKYNFVLNELNKMDDKKEWYEKKIVELYITDNHTIRSLSKATKISAWSIQQTIYHFKNKCKKSFRQSKDI